MNAQRFLALVLLIALLLAPNQAVGYTSTAAPASAALSAGFAIEDWGTVQHQIQETTNSTSPIMSRVCKLGSDTLGDNDGDFFGMSIAVSGDTIVAGAGYDNNYTGSAYIFARNQDGADYWNNLVKIVAGGGSDGDHFGESVSISGDTIVVGAPRDYSNGPLGGSAYIFARNRWGEDQWGQVIRITADDADGGYESFGKSVAISGDTIVAGAAI